MGNDQGFLIGGVVGGRAGAGGRQVRGIILHSHRWKPQSADYSPLETPDRALERPLGAAAQGDRTSRRKECTRDRTGWMLNTLAAFTRDRTTLYSSDPKNA